MSTLYITEYAKQGGGHPLGIPVAEEPAITTQTVSFTATHGESSAFNANTSLVRIHTDGICSILFGTAPVATTSHPRLAANQTEYFAVVAPGASGATALKVSAVTNT